MPFLNDDKFYNFIFYALRIQIQNRIFISISDILKVFFYKFRFMEYTYEDIKYTKIELQQFLDAYRKATDNYIITSITDQAGFIIHANPKFCEISQYTFKELKGKTHQIINANFHSTDFFKIMWGNIKAGKIWEGKIKNRAKDGTEYWLETTIIPIKNKKKEIVQFFSIRTLITDKKLAQAKKTKNFNELQKLLHMISHEVRKPITNLLGITNVYSRIPPDPLESVFLMNYIKQNSIELDEFTKRLTQHIYELSLDEKNEID